MSMTSITWSPFGGFVPFRTLLNIAKVTDGDTGRETMNKQVQRDT
jgi:hypothetical protein